MATKRPPKIEAYTTGTTLRMEKPNSSRKPKPSTAKIIVHEVNPVNGFMDFLREYGVVGLAIGFVIGLQAQNLMRQLVSSFIDPAFKLLFGEALSTRSFTLTYHGRTAEFPWGAFVYILMNFIFVLITIYLIFRLLKLDKLSKPPKKAELDKMKELKR